MRKVKKLLAFLKFIIYESSPKIPKETWQIKFSMPFIVKYDYVWKICCGISYVKPISILLNN